MSDDFVLPIPGRLAGLESVEVAIVLGSGLSGLGERVESATVVPYSEIEGYPGPGNVVGHAGKLVVGTLGGTRVACFAGRVHSYQGVSAKDAAWTARVAAALGASTLVVTNAAGGVDESLRTGTLVLLSDHMNLTGDSPLVGWPGPAGGNPFVPMSDAYDAELRAIAIQAALAEDVAHEPEGVYAGLLGPAYETPAEARMLRTLGADVVGMSTVHEVIAARALGMRVLGMSLVTNAAAGEGLSHAEVLEAGERAAADMERLAIAILQRL